MILNQHKKSLKKHEAFIASSLSRKTLIVECLISLKEKSKKFISSTDNFEEFTEKRRKPKGKKTQEKCFEEESETMDRKIKIVES